jgi:hypothetical protein
MELFIISAVVIVLCIIVGNFKFKSKPTATRFFVPYVVILCMSANIIAIGYGHAFGKEFIKEYKASQILIENTKKCNCDCITEKTINTIRLEQQRLNYINQNNHPLWGYYVPDEIELLKPME